MTACSNNQQINSIVEKAKNLISWILRTFKARDYVTMITLYKSLVIPILEYCSVLWSPINNGSIQQLESIQWSFLRKIRGNNSRNYWDSLKGMKIYSLQRRRERYRVLYTWKILENLVPNVNNKVQPKDHIRLGRTTCTINCSNSKTQKLREGSLTINGPKLSISLSKHVHDLKGVPISTIKLDSHLATIPDEPLIQGYTACRRANSNQMFDMSKSRCLFGFFVF